MITRNGKLLIIVLLLAVFLVPGGCSNDYPELSLEPSEDVDSITAPTPQYHPQTPITFSPETPYIRLAIAPVTAPVQTREDYHKLQAHFLDQLGQPVELVLRSTHAEINQLLRQGLVDAAMVGSYSYVELESTGDIELLAVPLRGGQTHHHSYIIVPEESDFENLEDLHNEKFVFTDSLSFPGKLYLNYRLEEMGETPDSFFSDYIFSYSHDNSIIAVAEEWVSAASVCSLVFDHLIEENPELKDRVRVIEASPAVGNPPVVVKSGLDEELREKIEEFFLSMHLDSQGLEALEEMRVEQFVPGDEVDYVSVKEMTTTGEGND